MVSDNKLLKVSKMKLYIFILISFFGITNLISLNEEEDKIAFCKNILDNPNSLIEIVKHSVFYDSNSFANIFKYYNYHHKYIKEFIQIYSQFDKFVIQSNISNIDELTNTRVHTISFYYPGIENGVLSR